MTGIHDLRRGEKRKNNLQKKFPLTGRAHVFLGREGIRSMQEPKDIALSIIRRLGSGGRKETLRKGSKKLRVEGHEKGTRKTTMTWTCRARVGG